jgi:uncharacterized membrane protein YecN with MAPEG domain
MSFATPLYAGFFGLLLVFLSWRVVNLRNRYQVKMGDGGHSELTAAVRAYDNLLEYLPTALVLMMMLEFLGFNTLVIHVLGLWLVGARLLHLKGIQEPSGASKSRRIGTRLTWVQMAATAIFCLIGSFGFTF